jgi:hypothetical protein
MFCCRVRYSLWESTVFLVGEYGIPCGRVRYSLSGSTVFLVGEYGIPCGRVRYCAPGALTRNNRRICRTFVKTALGAGQVGAKTRGEFVGEYGIFCGRVRYRFVGEYGIRGNRAGKPILWESTVFFGEGRLPLKAISMGKSSVSTALSGARIGHPHQMMMDGQFVGEYGIP